MYGFQLGREYKLSIAELLIIFSEGKTIYFDKQVLILDGINKDNILKILPRLGGTIKVFNVEEIKEEEIYNKILLEAKKNEGKFKYGLSLFFSSTGYIKNILNKTKKTLKENNISSRFVNKDFKNLSSAQILGEKLIQKKSDFNFIKSEEKIFFGTSIWIQDINEYSKRDFQKERDMQTGMLPPKLAQIMINLSEGKNVYDPFVGLGTILIESIITGNNEVYGSDLSEKMVKNTINNIKKFSGINSKIEKLNAKFIEESEFLKKADVIVTEGYLGEIMTQSNISHERIEKQKESLIKIYEPFFAGLKKANFKGNIVISFPFWELKGKIFYFTNIYDIIKMYCNIQKIFPTDFSLSETRLGSLLYKREKQLVGREIFKLKIK